MWVGSLMSSSRTGGGSGRRFAERSVRRRARPNPVKTRFAPCSWATRAVCQAIESSVSTPVTTSRFPSSNTPGPPGRGGVMLGVHPGTAPFDTVAVR